MIKKGASLLFLFATLLNSAQNNLYLNISTNRINKTSIYDSVSCRKDLIKIFNYTDLKLNFSFEKEKYRPYDAFGDEFTKGKVLIYKKVFINSLGASLGMFNNNDSVFCLKKILFKQKRGIDLNFIFKDSKGVCDTLVLGKSKFNRINKKYNLKYYKTGLKMDINEIATLKKKHIISYYLGDDYCLDFKNYGTRKKTDWRVYMFSFKTW
ncbi:MAG: hypothetical protein CMP61_08640 [Flavobacteriales bacterium]|nr:hypothetical protein [Flavobacteriales bacterium]|tara:strand:- start:10851 stop:11477 length:627 start_codon:yes stop_codon:yes gene_type:complete